MNRSPAFYIWWKELRGLAPVWSVAMLAMLVTLILPVSSETISGLQLIIYFVGSMIMSSIAYTQEIRDKTLMWQFVQPIDRWRILMRKFLILTGLQALFSVTTWGISAFAWGSNTPELLLGGSVAILSVTSCCFWGLLLRSALNTVVIAFLVPLVLLGILGGTMEPLLIAVAADSTNQTSDILMMHLCSAGMIVYSIICGCLAVRLWRRYQLTGDTESVSPIEAAAFSRFVSDRVFRIRPLWWNIARRELGLLRLIVVIALGFVFFGAVFIATDRFIDWWLISNSLNSDWVDNISEFQVAIRAIAMVVLVLVLGLVPLLCGALAFGEEKSIGNRAWELCQPVGSTHQCLIKITTSLGVSMIVGLALPIILGAVYASIRTEELIQPDFEQGDLSGFIATHVLLYSVAAWCSTWSRNSLFSVMKVFLVVTLLATVQVNQTHAPDWRIAAWAIAIASIGGTLLNFKMLDVPPRRWIGQWIVLMIVVVGASMVALEFK